MIALGVTGCVSLPGRAEPASRSFTFVQLCDPQLGMGGYQHDVRSFEQAVRQINRLQPDFVVICGDLVHNPGSKSFADFNRIRAGLDMPSYCVPGNHDVGNEATPATLARYHDAIGKDYYAFEHKGHTFVCVNTQLWKAPVEGASEAQDQWLADTLEAASLASSPVLVVGHYPLFVKSPDEPEGYYNLPLARRQELLDLFQKHGVVAVLTGHLHKAVVGDYEGIALVTGETTSRTHGGPLGFILWQVDPDGEYLHESVPLEAFEEHGQ